MKELGAALRKLRNSRGLNQEEVPLVAENKLGKRTLVGYEAGERRPPRKQLLALLTLGYNVRTASELDRFLSLAGFAPLNREDLDALGLGSKPLPPQTDSATDFETPKQMLRDAVRRANYQDAIDIVLRLQPLAGVDARFLEEIVDSLWLLSEICGPGDEASTRGWILLAEAGQISCEAGHYGPSLRYRVCLALSKSLWSKLQQREYAITLDLADRALTHADVSTDRTRILASSIRLGRSLALVGLRKWELVLENAAAFFEEMGEPSTTVLVRYAIGIYKDKAQSLHSLGDHHGVLTACRAALDLCTQVTADEQFTKRVLALHMMEAYTCSYLNRWTDVTLAARRAILVAVERKELPIIQEVMWHTSHTLVADLRNNLQFDDAIALCDLLIDTFQHYDNVGIQERIAWAIGEKGKLLRRHKAVDQASKTYEVGVRRYSTSPDAAIQRQVAWMMADQADILLESGDAASARGGFEEVIETFSHRVADAGLCEELSFSHRWLGVLDLRAAKEQLAKEKTSVANRLLESSQQRFRTAAQIFKTESVLHYVGYALFLQGKREKSRETIRAAIKQGGQAAVTALEEEIKHCRLREIDPSFERLLSAVVRDAKSRVDSE